MTRIRPFVRLSLGAALLLAAPLSAEGADPEEAAPCNQAEVLAMMGPTINAADLYLACAKVPGQTPFKVAQSRYARLQLLEAMKKRELAEAELVALTSPPLAKAPVFTNSRTTGMIFGGEQSIGVTQVDLLAARSGYRLVAEDLPATRELADRAIALAGYDPALLLDAAPAFAMRTRLALAEKNTEQGIKLAVRAFVRGSEDPLVKEVIGQQPPAAQEQLKQLRTYLHDELGGYPFAISAMARATQKPEDLARAVADAKSAAAKLEAFERTQLGPL